MNLLRFATLSCSAVIFTLSAHADSLTYLTPGYPVLSTTITATSTGKVVATYLGGNTLGTDSVRLIDETTGTAFAYVVSNGTATIGEKFVLGTVNQGDTLALQLVDTGLFDPEGHYLSSGGTPNPVLSSDSTESTDGVSDVYVATGKSGALFADFEDIPRLPDAEYPGSFYTDSDYNDVRLKLSDVTGSSVTAVAPEPGTVVLLGTGVLSAAGVLRRRLRS